MAKEVNKCMSFFQNVYSCRAAAYAGAGSMLGIAAIVTATIVMAGGYDPSDIDRDGCCLNFVKEKDRAFGRDVHCDITNPNFFFLCETAGETLGFACQSMLNSAQFCTDYFKDIEEYTAEFTNILIYCAIFLLVCSALGCAIGAYRESKSEPKYFNA